MNLASAPGISQFAETSLFLLGIKTHLKSAFINLALSPDKINTDQLPGVIPVLRNTLPAIFDSTCYNTQNLPFRTEILKTETGHLFEHILLEYLCEEKIINGSRTATFTGLTTWNWHTNRLGSFQIRICLSPQDHKLFYNALSKSIVLLKQIIEFPKPETANSFGRLFSLS